MRTKTKAMHFHRWRCWSRCLKRPWLCLDYALICKYSTVFEFEAISLSLVASAKMYEFGCRLLVSIPTVRVCAAPKDQGVFSGSSVLNFSTHQLTSTQCLSDPYQIYFFSECICTIWPRCFRSQATKLRSLSECFPSSFVWLIVQDSKTSLPNSTWLDIWDHLTQLTFMKTQQKHKNVIKHWHHHIIWIRATSV